VHVERRTGNRLGGAKSAALSISLLSALQCPAGAQVVPIPNYNGNVITGGSTLDLIKPPKGDKVDFQLPSGFNCRVDAGDVPGLVVYGDRGGLDNSFYNLSGTRVGIAFILPLYRSRRDLCDKAVKSQNMADSLELAERLVDSGAMTNEEYLELARKYKKVLMDQSP
jgi:hypothetical protein